MTFNTHDQVPDSPTNTFATFNPLVEANVTLSNGNLTHTQNTWSNTNHNSNSTLAIPVGKFYWEGYYYRTSGTKDNPSWGVFNNIDLNPLADAVSGDDDHVTYWPNNADANNYYKNGSTTNTTGGHSTGSNFLGFHIAMCCVEMDANGTGKIWFGSNGAWHNGGSPNDPSTDDTYVTFTSKTVLPYFDAPGGELAIWIVNFGQDSSFGGNKTSGSANATDANGIGNFYYQPPTGALALCSANLPDPNLDPNVDDLSEDNMKTVIWTGDNNNGRQIDIDAVGTGTGFPPDMVWIAIRTGTAGVQCTTDSVRGVDSILSTNRSHSDSSYDASWRSAYGQVTEFNSTGFKVNKGSSTSNFNSNNNTYVGWSFRAGGAPSSDGVAMVDGTATTCSALATSASASITPTRMSVNTKAGFSIIKAYTTNVQANDMTESVPHGLTQTPHFVISKPITLSHPWMVYHKNGFNGNAPNNLQGLQLNSSNPQFTNSSYHTVEVTNSVIKFGRQTIEFNNNYIVFYVWHSVPGYSAFGSYTGNGSPSGPFVYLGFKPAFVLLKHSTGSNQHWWLYDNKRDPNNYVGRAKYANLTSNEGSQSEALDFLSNGFRITSNSNVINGTGQNCIYMAFAEQPGKYSNAR